MALPPKLAIVEGDDRAPQSPAERARLERMFVSYHATVWRTLRRRGLQPEAAADATQEAFIVAARRLSDIAPDSERAFLIGTALRMAHTLRRKTTRWQLDDNMDERAAGQRDLGVQLAELQICDLALSRLKDELAEVFVLHAIAGLTSPEIAALLEIPLGSVASRLRRAREQFRAALVHIQRAMEREQQQ